MPSLWPNIVLASLFRSGYILNFENVAKGHRGCKVNIKYHSRQIICSLFAALENNLLLGLKRCPFISNSAKDPELTSNTQFTLMDSS